MIKKSRKYLTNPETPIYERCFVVTTLTAVMILILIFIWDLIIGESPVKLAVLGVTILCMWLTVGICLRFKAISVGGFLMSIAIVFFVLPIEFFYGGGVYGYTPIWYAYAFLFISINVKGKKRYILLGLLGASGITCYVVSYKFPSLLTRHTAGVAYLDSIASLIGVGVLLWLTVRFLMRIYNSERVRAEEQAKEINEMNRAQSHFFSSMSHEIRTPINTIIGLNEMILREDVSQEVAEFELRRNKSTVTVALKNDTSEIIAFAVKCVDKEGITGMDISQLANRIYERYPNFKPSQIGYATFQKFVHSIPDLQVEKLENNQKNVYIRREFFDYED